MRRRFRQATKRQQAGEDADEDLVDHVAEQDVVLGQFEELSQGTEPLSDRFMRSMHPWSSYLVLPVFALANAGVELSGTDAYRALSSPATLGILLGLVLGKPLGILGFAWLAERFNLARRPGEITWPHIAGIGMLGGIGFTVALFITALAFTEPEIGMAARMGILVASTIAGIAGYLYLRRIQNR